MSLWFQTYMHVLCYCFFVCLKLRPCFRFLICLKMALEIQVEEPFAEPQRHQILGLYLVPQLTYGWLFVKVWLCVIV
jgi:hypothetical protein